MPDNAWHANTVAGQRGMLSIRYAHDERLQERTGRLEERDKRIAAEQRARDLGTKFADLAERLRRKP